MPAFEVMEYDSSATYYPIFFYVISCAECRILDRSCTNVSNMAMIRFITHKLTADVTGQMSGNICAVFSGAIFELFHRSLVQNLSVNSEDT